MSRGRGSRQNTGVRVPPPRAHPRRLTSRETEIAALVAQGLSNVEIAKRSYVSVKTVRPPGLIDPREARVRGRMDIARETIRLGLVSKLAAAPRIDK